jgi:hypothetical protein
MRCKALRCAAVQPILRVGRQHVLYAVYVSVAAEHEICVTLQSPF